MTKGNFARIDIACSKDDAERLADTMKGELGRRVFHFLEEFLNGPIEVRLEIKTSDVRAERIWSRE